MSEALAVKVSDEMSQKMDEKPMFVIVGPSGVGKTTLYKMLLKEFEHLFELSISYTTRPIRKNETNGIHYHFVTEEAFNEMKDADEFLECTSYVGNQYGTAVREIKRIQGSNKVPLLEIEIDGFGKVRRKGLPLRSVFVTTSDVESLRNRLISRGGHNITDMDKRLKRAMEEMKEANDASFDVILVNDDLNVAYAQLRDHVLKWYGLPNTDKKQDEPSGQS
ncbi:guanylate kinase, putative [Babesia bigemina]|uniref:guanylate kinase n=1 Tax=Babesia bigemina TaxID=5866 RepID=A0A061D1S9_BABBI|nr:guanylate kinase, putative [Babesia bigemina]CDR94087.1 guanylate kinase, putative [Babesia bigemina]|eukprot:XP_012766273.1 guanylate kinase, putative [Babesia bigemina]